MTSQTIAESILSSATCPTSTMLLEEVHRRGLRLILDFVPNHTSDQHPWFLESRSSRDNAKRDWYIWRDQPNNWTSNFGGSAWEFDELTGQYYYHSFLKQQPDLNWRNPAVKAAMFDVLRFWLRKGVDGFRVDVMWMIIKDDQFRDNPPNPGYHAGLSSNQRFLPVYNTNRPEVHAIVAEMRSVIDQFSDRVLIGEIYLPVAQLMTYYGKHLEGANLPFNFHLLQCAWSGGCDRPGHWRLLPGASAGCVAELGSRQPRSAPHRFPGRQAAGARCGHAAFYLARYAHHVLRRGDWHDQRAHRCQSRCRIQRRRTSPASVKAAIPNGRQCAGIEASMLDSLRECRGCPSARTCAR